MPWRNPLLLGPAFQAGAYCFASARRRISEALPAIAISQGPRRALHRRQGPPQHSIQERGPAGNGRTFSRNRWARRFGVVQQATRRSIIGKSLGNAFFQRFLQSNNRVQRVGGRFRLRALVRSFQPGTPGTISSIEHTCSSLALGAARPGPARAKSAPANSHRGLSPAAIVRAGLRARPGRFASQVILSAWSPGSGSRGRMPNSP